MSEIRGIIPALITPYTADGRINEDSLEKIISLNMKKGVSGFYVCGSTAEAFLLSLEERKRVLEVVTSCVDGKASVIAHIGCISTDEAIELGMHAEKAGADAVSSIPPFYYKFSPEEIRGHYRKIADKVSLPIILYNFPAATGCSLTGADSRDLLADPHVIGVKHTSYNLYELERMKQLNNELIVLNGHDEVYLGGLAMGADGAIGSTYNFMAEKFIMMNQHFGNGELQAAQKLQSEANNIIDVLVEVGLLAGIKYILGLQGIECGHCRSPFKRLPDTGKAKLDEVLKLNLA
jgi:N-acetylneuraminate lyase